MSERVRVILNGDDFGYSIGTNKGINEAIDKGILTSTSVMVNREAAPEAEGLVKRIKGKNISVGLHLDLTEEGLQRWTGLIQIFTWSEGEARKAFSSQIEKFQKITGQLPDHIDSHHGVHMHPKIKPWVMRFSQENGIPVRQYSGVSFELGFYGRSLMHWKDPNNVSGDKLIKALEGLSPGDHEIMCHPGYVDEGLRDSGTTYLKQREAELKALTSEAVRSFVENSKNVALVSWKDFRS